MSCEIWRVLFWQTTTSMLHGGASYMQIHRMGLVLSLVAHRWTDFAVTFLKKKTKDLLRTWGSCISSASRLQHRGSEAGKKKRPNRCWMAAGEEKDTADKRINYFINFISQLTLHATFQVSQPGDEQRCRALEPVTLHQPGKKVWVRENMRWGKMNNPEDNSFPCSLQKQRQKWPDNIVISIHLKFSTYPS